MGCSQKSPALRKFLSFFWWGGGLCYMRQKDRERQKARNCPPRGDGHATIPSPPFSPWDLGHAHTCFQREFKPQGPGLKPPLTTRESSYTAITPTAGPYLFIFERDFSYRACALTRETESKKSPPLMGWPCHNPFSSILLLGSLVHTPMHPA